jgi:hypothetical protein
MTVTQRDWLRELAPDRGERGEEAFRANLREHYAEFLRLLACLAEPTAATELDQHPFRAERHQRARRADEQTAATRTRRGHVEELSATRAQMLDDLAQGQEEERSVSEDD